MYVARTYDVIVTSFWGKIRFSRRLEKWAASIKQALELKRKTLEKYFPHKNVGKDPTFAIMIKN